MSFERIMGLEIIDEETYQAYREAMAPLLADAGGYFGFDFKVSEVLRSKTDKPINRVFTITFPSKKAMDEFFSSTSYLKVKEQYFNRSVGNITVISMHEKTE